MAIFRTTIELCIRCENDAEAADFLSESFREWLMAEKPILKDWQYKNAGGFISNMEEISQQTAEYIFGEYGHY